MRLDAQTAVSEFPVAQAQATAGEFLRQILQQRFTPKPASHRRHFFCSNCSRVLGTTVMS